MSAGASRRPRARSRRGRSGGRRRGTGGSAGRPRRIPAAASRPARSGAGEPDAGARAEPRRRGCAPASSPSCKAAHDRADHEQDEQGDGQRRHPAYGLRSHAAATHPGAGWFPGIGQARSVAVAVEAGDHADRAVGDGERCAAARGTSARWRVPRRRRRRGRRSECASVAPTGRRRAARWTVTPGRVGRPAMQGNAYRPVVFRCSTAARHDHHALETRRAHRRHRLDRHRPPDDLPGPVHRLAGRRPAGQGLAVLPGRGPRRPPRRRRGEHRLRHGLPGPAPGRWSAPSAQDFDDYRSWLERHGVDTARCTSPSCGTPHGSCAPPTPTTTRSPPSTPAR